MKRSAAIIVLLFILPLNYSLYSCTSFCISTQDETVFGKNYDWFIDYGLVIVNKKGIDKIAFVNNDIPAKWKSKYGSVTFNQFGREFPNGGMNEAGLVVELMWLDETKYPEKDDRASVGSTLGWIQYQLDNCASIEEVIQTDKFIRINRNSVPIHYLVTDKTGASVTIEFIDGKLVWHDKESLPYGVLTNSTARESIDYLNQHEGFGGSSPLNNSKGSLDRFVTACSMVKNYDPSIGKNAVEYGFSILDEVNQGDFTKWSIVYDIRNMKVFYRTGDNPVVRNLEFSGLDFNCNTPVKMIDINSYDKGNVNAELTEYSPRTNRELIENSYSNVDFLKKVTSESKDKASKYPEILTCDDSPQPQTGSNDFYNNPMNYLNSPVAIAAGGFLIISFVVLYRYKHKKRNQQ
jgi:penicillin V acylase-like amidase (Ntn superfamily)